MDRNQQSEFRNSTAGLVKSLIRARARQEPEFLCQDDYARWGVADVVSESRSTVQLLRHAQALKNSYYDTNYSVSGSTPAPGYAEQADAVDAVRGEMAGFIFGNLDKAIRAAARGGQVDWDGLADWQALGRIRDLLDQLPEPETDYIPVRTPARNHTPKKTPVAASPRVRLYGPKEEPEIDGREKPLLTGKRYELIKKLIDMRPQRCSKGQLEKITTNYWKSLKDLTDRDEDWKSVIQFAGTSHQGYSIE